jgi:hypothetical protein
VAREAGLAFALPLNCHGPQKRAIQVTPALCAKWIAAPISRSLQTSTGWPAFAGHDTGGTAKTIQKYFFAQQENIVAAVRKTSLSTRTFQNRRANRALSRHRAWIRSDKFFFKNNLKTP